MSGPTAFPVRVSGIDSSGPGRVSAGTIVFRHRGALRVAVIAKATFDIVHLRPLQLRAPDPLVARDQHWERNAARSVHQASDLAPYHPRVDVTFVGDAHAPEGRPVPASTVRLALLAGTETVLDRTIQVYGDRDSNGAPQPFERMSLVYERSVFSADNSVGTRSPTLVDLRDPKVPAAFGPISRLWLPRKRKLLGRPAPTGDTMPDPRKLSSSRIVEFPPDFDWSYFQVAPESQQLDALANDEWLVLEGLHPTVPRLRAQLPRARASAQVLLEQESGSTRGPELELVPSSLAIDGERMICSILFRASFPVTDEAALPFFWVRVALAVGEEPIDWPPIPASPSPPAHPEIFSEETSTLTHASAQEILRGAALPFHATAGEVEAVRRSVESGGTGTLTAPEARALRDRAVLPFEQASVARSSADLPPHAVAASIPCLGPTDLGFDRNGADVRIINLTPLQVTFMVAHLRPPTPSLAVIVKGTFDLIQNGPLRLREMSDPPVGDLHLGGDQSKPLLHASDFAPFKPRADVTLIGRACSLRGPVASMPVRFRFGNGARKLDRSFVVRGETQPCEQMPVLSFAPLPASSPGRWSKRGTYDEAWTNQRAPFFPRDFEWAHFQSAPDEQQLAYLDGDEPFEIDGMNRAEAAVRGTLPGLRARAFALGSRLAGGRLQELQLHLDTAAFDVERGSVQLVWRGHFDVSTKEAPELAAFVVTRETLGGVSRTLDELRVHLLSSRAPAGG